MPNSNNHNEEYNEKIEIELMKRDISMITKLCEKFDAAIEKLQQVASDLSKVISLQEQRSTALDKINASIEKAMDDNEKEYSKKMEKMEIRIKDLEKSLSEKEKNIIEKIDKIEAWRYMIMGAISLVVFAIGHILDVYKILG